MYEANYKSLMGNVKLRFKITAYQYDKSLAIQAYSEDEGYWCPFCTITVCLNVGCAEDCAFVDSNNVPGIEEFLIKNGIAKQTGRVQQSGFCMYNEFKFNKRILKEMDLEGYEKYLNFRNS